MDGGETVLFKQYFSTWKDEDSALFAGVGRFYPASAIAEWDVASLHSENRRRLARAAGAAVGFMPDGSRGDKEVFRVEDFDLVPVNKDMHGMFFAGDSYVIRYTTEDGRGIIVYFWQVWFESHCVRDDAD